MNQEVKASTAPSAPPIHLFKFAASDSCSISVRALARDGETLFHGADICGALGYVNVSQSLADHVDPDDKHIVSIGLPGRAPIFVTESGMYSLVLRSNKPEAKAFKRWVAKDVLPTIRKQGAYVHGASHLSPAQQDALYASVSRLVAEVVRRYDRETEHAHWRTRARQRQYLDMAAKKVAHEMGLPLPVVLAAGSHGGDAALAMLAKVGA